MGAKSITFERALNFINSTSSKANFNKEWFDKNFKGINTVMPYICSCGEPFEKSYRTFKRDKGSQCKKCGVEKIKEARKLSFEDIVSFIKNNGCEPGFNEDWFHEHYIDVHTYMRFICQCGRTFRKSLFNFKYGKLKKCNSKCNGTNFVEQQKDYELQQKLYEDKKRKQYERQVLESKKNDFLLSTRDRATELLKLLILESGTVGNLDSIESIEPEIYRFLTKDRNKRLIECLNEIYGEDYNYIHILDAYKVPGFYWNEHRALDFMNKTYQQNGYIKLTRPRSLGWFIDKKGKDYYLKKLGLTKEQIAFRRPVGYWDDLSNVIKEIQPLIKKNNGTFPTINKIVKEIGISQKKIDELGGIYFIRKIMGYEKLEFKANDGHYLRSSLEVIVDNILFFNKVPHDVDKKISDEKEDKNYRYDFFAYKHGYYIEVWGLEDTSEAYRKKKKDKIKFYKSKKLKLIQINAKDFKREDLMIDIITQKLKPILDNPVEYTQEDKDRIIPEKTINFSNLIEELTPYMPFPECIPSYVRLRRNGRHDLSGFIARNGGVKKVGKRLGLKTKGDYYFDKNKKEQVIEELNKLNVMLGFIPTLANLQKIHPWLYQSLGKVGGYNKVLNELSLIKEVEFLKNNKRPAIYEDVFKNPLSQKNNLIIKNIGNNIITNTFKRKAVMQLTLKGELVKECDSYDSAIEVGNPDSIRKACRGIYNKGHKYKGFLWFYKEDYEEIKETKLKEIIVKYQHSKTRITNRITVNKSNPIFQLSEDGEIFYEYSCLIELEERGFNKKTVSKACKGTYINGHKYKGYYWCYKKDYEQMLRENEKIAM